MTAALEGGEWSAARPGHTLPQAKTQYPLYRRLGGPQGQSGRAENLVPTGIRSRTIQPVVSRYTNWATWPTSLWCGFMKCSLWLLCGEDSKLNNPLGRYPTSGARRLLKCHMIIILTEKVADKELWMVMRNAFRQHFVKCLPVKESTKQLPITDSVHSLGLFVIERVKWTYKMPEFGTVNHQGSTNITVQRLPHFVM